MDVRRGGVGGAEVGVIALCLAWRVAQAAVEEARRKGVKFGHLRLVQFWPFPSSRIAELSKRVKTFIVPERNMGQMVLEVERAGAGRAAVVSLPHAGGTVHEPQVILDKILEASSRGGKTPEGVAGPASKGGSR